MSQPTARWEWFWPEPHRPIHLLPSAGRSRRTPVPVQLYLQGQAIALCRQQEMESFRSGTEAPMGPLCPRRWGVQSAQFRGPGGPTDGKAGLNLEDGMWWRGF